MQNIEKKDQLLDTIIENAPKEKVQFLIKFYQSLKKKTLEKIDNLSYEREHTVRRNGTNSKAVAKMDMNLSEKEENISEFDRTLVLISDLIKQKDKEIEGKNGREDEDSEKTSDRRNEKVLNSSTNKTTNIMRQVTPEMQEVSKVKREEESLKKLEERRKGISEGIKDGYISDIDLI